MEVVISGSRSIKDRKHVEAAIDASGWHITRIIHGAAGGVDQSATKVAVKRGIPFTPVPAQWDNFYLPKVVQKFRYDGHEYNAAAGDVRNELMVSILPTDGGLIAVWDGNSTGTANCIAHALLADKKVFIYLPDSNESYHVRNSAFVKEFAKDVVNLGYKKATNKWRGNRYTHN